MNTSLSTEEASERRSKRRQAESKLFSLEADRGHMEREERALGVALMSLRQSLRQTESSIGEQESKLKRVETKMMELDTEIEKAKRELRLL